MCFLVEDWENVYSFHHTVGVRKVFPDLNGSRIVFIDDKNGGYLLSPSNVLFTILQYLLKNYS